MKTVKMIFPQDTFYNLELLYRGGEVIEVPENMVERWLKRGGQIVDEIDSQAAPVQEAPHEEEELVEKEEPEHDEKEEPRKSKGRHKRHR